MKSLLKIVVALLVFGALYATGPGRKSALAGVWRGRTTDKGMEMNAKLDLQPSGDITLTATVTPLDASLFFRGQRNSEGLPARSFTLSAKGKWSVWFNQLRVRFDDTNPRIPISLNDLYGGKIVSIQQDRFIYRARKQRGSSETEEETWYRRGT